MPVTFGSVGDIISVCLLLKDLVAALNDCKGSAHSFQQLTTQLQILEQTLLEVHQLVRKHEASPDLNALCVTVREAAIACRSSAAPFFEKVKSYQKSLKAGGSGNLFKDVARKVRWRALERDEVDKFYAQVTAHTSSLEMLLALWGISTVELDGSHTRQAIIDINDGQKASDQAQQSLLQRILDRVGDVANTSINMLQKAVSLSQLQWLQQLGSKLTIMMSRIQDSTFKTYNTVLTMNNSLSWLCAQTLLLDVPMVLTDSHGRRMPIHLQFINSWEAFDAVLEVRFRALPGHTKIMNKQFVLQDCKSGRDVERRRPWDGAVTAGQRLNMDMIFRQARTQESIACPGCLKESSESVTVGKVTEKQCESCGLHYKLVTSEAEPTTVAPVPVLPQLAAPKVTIPGPALKRRADPNEDLDRPGDFKRVRLLSTLSSTVRRDSFDDLSRVLGVSPISARVYYLLQTGAPSVKGLNALDVAGTLNMTYPDALQASDELMNHGLIYSTVDDNTFAVLDYFDDDDEIRTQVTNMIDSMSRNNARSWPEKEDGTYWIRGKYGMEPPRLIQPIMDDSFRVSEDLEESDGDMHYLCEQEGMEEEAAADMFAGPPDWALRDAESSEGSIDGEAEARETTPQSDSSLYETPARWQRDSTSEQFEAHRPPDELYNRYLATYKSVENNDATGGMDGQARAQKTTLKSDSQPYVTPAMWQDVVAEGSGWNKWRNTSVRQPSIHQGSSEAHVERVRELGEQLGLSPPEMNILGQNADQRMSQEAHDQRMRGLSEQLGLSLVEMPANGW